jgi:hypothetical protein
MAKEFEMTEQQLNRLLDSCKPVPYMIIGGILPRSPQENANDAWMLLGREMGFEWDTVEPVYGKSNRFFTAEVLESEKGEK